MGLVFAEKKRENDELNCFKFFYLEFFVSSPPLSWFGKETSIGCSFRKKKCALGNKMCWRKMMTRLSAVGLPLGESQFQLAPIAQLP